jgi:hypothetical protein
MTDLQKRMIESLQLRGIAERTQLTCAQCVSSPSPITNHLTCHQGRTQTLFPVHQECQELCPRHDDHRPVRDQVLRRVDAARKLL